MASRVRSRRYRSLRTLTPTSPDVIDALRAAIAEPARVLHRASDRLGLANDASHYALTPQAVVIASNATEIANLLHAAAAHGLALTFRSGGTSLGGQGVTNGVLVDTRRHFRAIEVLNDGVRVRVQPGATVRHVNARLAPYGRKIGPDPASESACTIGGVIANNSSGMACGTRHNAYQTLESLLLVLPSGTVVDTSAPDADELLRAREPMLHEGLIRLRDRVRHNPASVAAVQQQFAMKNTMGYALNAFLDHTKPIDLLAHLVVGSEGTLAFVAEAVFRTIEVLPHATTGLLVFDSLRAATAVLPDLAGTGAATIELLDAASLRVAQRDPQADRFLRHLRVQEHAALLVEYQASSAEALTERFGSARKTLDALPLSAASEFTEDRRARQRLWHVRKGLYAAVAGARAAGTTALLEDVVVPVPRLLPACEELADALARHGYVGSVIFGHAKDGNLHFMLTERFDQRESLLRYQRFTDDLVDLVLGHGGSLKAEHGTGRMMSPYVRRQYGDELYDVMRELKRLCDPGSLLNPGVIIDDDPSAHLRNTKSTPTVDTEVDRCVECGYCEPVCPSRDLTTTPRQRIVLRRAMATAAARGDLALLRELEAEFAYDGVDTCAVDGMCQTACPVLINTGDLVKRLRAETRQPIRQAAWRVAASKWGATTRMAAAALEIADAAPAALVTTASRAARRMAGSETVPLWAPDLPRGGRRRPTSVAAHANADAVYFPSCLGSMFAPATGGLGVGSALIELCDRADVRLTVPEEINDLCCATPWSSKGFTSGRDVMRDKVFPRLLTATQRGRLPIVCDASSCTEGLTHLVEEADASGIAIRIVDAIEFTRETLLPKLTVHRRVPSLALHPTCSSTRLGTADAFVALAQTIAEAVTVPADWACCGFAGDRGLLHPELTASATRWEAAEVGGQEFTAYASSNRTCEIGMTRATGRKYTHLIELVEQATRPDQAS